MSDRRKNTFIDFSLKPPWRSAADLWQYFWVVYRIAEPQNDRTKAGEAFVALMRATEAANDENKTIEWAFTGEAISIKRSDVYRVVDRYVRRATSNYLIESKPPHKFLRRLATSETFVPKQVRWNKYETASLAVAFSADSKNLEALEKHFGVTQVTFEFKGYPLIGWTRSHVWFGVTPFRYLWLQAPEVRAAALEYPFRPLPEFLRLPWSPVSPDWRPPRRPNERIRAYERTVASEALFSILGEWEHLAPPRHFHGRLIDRMPGAPELAWTASTDDDVRAALIAIESYRDNHLVGSATLIVREANDTVARDVHQIQASSSHPISYWYMSDQQLEQYTRHFPWLWLEGRPRGLLLQRGESLPNQLVLTCFLETWRSLRPFRPFLKDLRRCWREIGMTDDFDALCRQLVDAGMIKLVHGCVELQAPAFSDVLSFAPPYSDLLWRVQDWFLQQRDLQSLWEVFIHGDGSPVEPPSQETLWQQTMWKLIGWRNPPSIGYGSFPSRAVHALPVYLDRYPDDCIALGQLTVFYLIRGELKRGVTLLNELRRRAGTEPVLDILHNVAVATGQQMNGGNERMWDVLRIGFDANGDLQLGIRDLGLLAEDIDPARLTEHHDSRVREVARALVEYLRSVEP